MPIGGDLVEGRGRGDRFEPQRPVELDRSGVVLVGEIESHVRPFPDPVEPRLGEHSSDTDATTPGSHASLAIRTGIPLELLRDQVAQFPTFHEAYFAALEMFGS